MDSILIDELVGSFQSYELDLPKTNKSKSTTLNLVDDIDDNEFNDELSSTEIAYLAKNFINFLRSMNRRSRGRNNAEPKNFKKNEPTKINNAENQKKKLFNLLIIL